MMTNDEIFDTALEQSAIDLSCEAEDFLKDGNTTVISRENVGARKYLKLPFEMQFVSYGRGVVASVREDLADIAEGYMRKFPGYSLFETPAINELNDALREFKLECRFMAEYFLPEINSLGEIPCRYETSLLTSADFETLYQPQWSNALCEKRRELDELGIGACDGGELVGLAACSADCEKMRQIGIDVLPEYRRQGVASALTSALAREIIKRGKVPFYCAAWSNIASVRNAVKSGFRPAWVELTVKRRDF